MPTDLCGAWDPLSDPYLRGVSRRPGILFSKEGLCGLLFSCFFMKLSRKGLTTVVSRGKLPTDSVRSL